MIITQISQELRSWEFTSMAVEESLHLEIAHVLTELGHKYLREHILNPRSRVDFYLPEHRIGIEVKVAGSVNEAIRQISRYNECHQIDGTILISSRAGHTSIPSMLADKPVRVVFIGGIK